MGHREESPVCFYTIGMGGTLLGGVLKITDIALNPTPTLNAGPVYGGSMSFVFAGSSIPVSSRRFSRLAMSMGCPRNEANRLCSIVRSRKGALSYHDFWLLCWFPWLCSSREYRGFKEEIEL